MRQSATVDNPMHRASECASNAYAIDSAFEEFRTCDDVGRGQSLAERACAAGSALLLVIGVIIVLSLGVLNGAASPTTDRHPPGPGREPNIDIMPRRCLFARAGPHSVRLGAAKLRATETHATEPWMEILSAPVRDWVRGRGPAISCHAPAGSNASFIIVERCTPAMNLWRLSGSCTHICSDHHSSAFAERLDHCMSILKGASTR